MRTYSIIILVFVFFSAISCSKENSKPLLDGPGFEIYLAKPFDKVLKDYNIDTIQINDTPILTANDIEFYDFSSHTFLLKEDRKKILNEIMDENNFFEDPLTPYVVVAHKKNIYLGYFRSINFSMGMINPYLIFDRDIFPSNVINISSGSNFTTQFNTSDLRSDERILQGLKDEGIYKAGISVRLEDVKIVENKDTSTIQYKFQITNNERDDIYIPDPDIMGEAIFNQYTLGVVLISSSQTIWPKYVSYNTTAFLNYNLSWYIKLIPGESISRTIKVKGYPNIPPGNYNCFFRYAAPTMIDYRVNANGSRYWSGWKDSNMISLEL